MEQAVKQQCDQQSSQQQMLKVLKSVYLTHRQIGASEATYRLLPNIHLKDSNISTVFLTPGFPENRYQFLKWAKDEDPEKQTVQIEGREGAYVWTMSIHEKYSKRPTSVNNLYLAELFINYCSAPEKELLSDIKYRRELPSVLKLSDNAGTMRLRGRPCVLRLHE